MDPTGTPFADGPTGRPVFVDVTGRRGRWMRRGGWVVTSLLVGYLVLVIAALLGPSHLSRLSVPGLGPLLPGPGAATLADGTGARNDPEAVLETTNGPSSRPNPGASRRATPQPPTSGGTVAASPTPTPSSPGRSGTAPGQSTAAPTPTSTASPSPVQGNRPTDRPTPRNTRAASPKAKPARSDP